MGARFSRGGRASAPPGFDLRANEATIDVALDKPLYHAGDEILGFVSAEIRRASILSLDVELTCTTQTRVHWTTHSGSGKKRKTHHHWASATHRVLRQRANVWAGSVAPTGRHQLPFEFVVPPDAPPSLGTLQFGNGHVRDTYARLSYAVAVRATLPAARDVVVHEVPVDVVGAPPPYVVPVQTVRELEVRRCACIKEGWITLGAAAGKSAYTGGEAPEVEFSCRTRVIQRRFNVSVPRAPVIEKASTLRGRSER